MVRKVLRKYKMFRTFMVSAVSAAVVINFAAHDVWAFFPDIAVMQSHTDWNNDPNAVILLDVRSDIPGGDVSIQEENFPTFSERPVMVLVANQFLRQYSPEEYDSMVEDFVWTIMGENQNELIKAFLDGDTDLFNMVVDSVAWVVMNRVKADESHMGGGTIQGVLSHTNSCAVPAFSCRWDKFGDPSEPRKFNIYNYRRYFLSEEVDIVYSLIDRALPRELLLSKKQISTRIEVIKLARKRLENDIFSGSTQDPTYGSKFYISDEMLREIDSGERPIPAHILNLRQRGSPEILIPGTGHVFFADRPI